MEAAALRSGDPARYRDIVVRHSPRLLAMLRSYTATDDEALDVLQVTWLRAYAKRGTLDGSGSVLGWLMQIARHAAIDEARRRRPGGPDVADRVADPGPDPLEHVERNELGRAVMEAIATLPTRQREVVMLRLVEGHSVRETATIMGCAEGTVKAALHRALPKLATLLEEWR